MGAGAWPGRVGVVTVELPWWSPTQIYIWFGGRWSLRWSFEGVVGLRKFFTKVCIKKFLLGFDKMSYYKER